MDTELLKTFLEVHKTRHFGKAAENLYLTQSAVSFRIRQLEQSLGVALFTRFRNNIQLTSAGELLLPHARSVIQAMAAAKQLLFLQTGRPVPFQWQIAQELAFLLQRLPDWPIELPNTVHIQTVSAATLIQEPLQISDGFIGFDGSYGFTEGIVKFSLGYLLVQAFRSKHDVASEFKWDLPITVPQLTDAPIGLTANDPILLQQYLGSQPCCGYLPSVLAPLQGIEPMPAQALAIEVCAYAPKGAEWPLLIAQKLQAQRLLMATASN